MDKEGIFWIGLWSTVGIVIVSLALIIAVWNHYNNIRYTEMWNNCVNAGGQPLYQPMLGRDNATFTCVRG